MPLLLLRDIPDTKEFFPSDILTLLMRYPIGDNLDKETVESNKNYLYVAILLHLTEDILQAQHSKADAQKQMEASDRFEKTVRLNIKDFAVPIFNQKNVQFPVLGPIKKLGEDFLEWYSRANMLIKSLQIVLAPSK